MSDHPSKIKCKVENQPKSKAHNPAQLIMMRTVSHESSNETEDLEWSRSSNPDVDDDFQPAPASTKANRPMYSDLI